MLLRKISVVGLVLLGACVLPKDSAFMNRGGPETLLDVSSEVVNLNLATAGDVTALGDWIAQDAPNRAELHCAAGSKHCADATSLLEKRGVPVAAVNSGANTVALIYERIVARDCNQRFREPRSTLWHNEGGPAHGCSVAANIVQHVSDKSVFINPPLSDDPSAVGPVDAMRRMNAPRQQTVQPYSVKDGLSTTTTTN